MNEKFNLAANVLLSRRFNNLLQIDENVEIDMDYITCAEYQLFIDEKLISGEHRQPDHWTSDRFPPGEARKPIVGVRASYAEEFCDWLTQQYSVLDFRYRLPTLTEVEEYPLTEGEIGYWCKDGKKNVIAGIEQTQWQLWKEHLNSSCRHDFGTVRSLANTFDSNQVLYVLFAKNIRENAKTINDNYLLKLSKALFAVTSPTILKHIEHIFNKIDFIFVLNINFVVDNTSIANIIKPAIADVIKNNASLLSDSMISNAQRVLQESESQLIKAEKEFQKLQRKFSEESKKYKELQLIFEEALYNLNYLKNIDREKQYEFREAENELIIATNNFKSFETHFRENEKKFKSCESVRDKIYEEFKSNTEKLNKAQKQYNQLQDDLNHISRRLSENSYYYLLFIALIFDWLLTQKDSSYQTEAQLKLTDQQSEGVSSDYATQRDEILDLYTFLVLRDERRSGRIPVWEGIRIVRERS
ncbi:hypothetical protein [Nostoc sp. C117]|uniref:hypothetical protein n=1 Tax=Nostoc sp. C117 TaxID=3349875 RepID=UPI00370D7099